MKYTFSMIAVLLIIALGIYKLSHHHKDIPTVTQKPNMTYFCKEGVLKATYGDTSVTVQLLDGRTITLPQTQSASGVRYESDGIAFMTKGDYASLMEGEIMTYTDCILGTEVENVDTSITFTDGSRQYSFSHSKDLSISGGSALYETTWRANTQALGQLFVVGTIDKDVQPDTNFSGATFSVGTSSDDDAVKNCTQPLNGEREKGDATINGVLYKKITFTDAGAGNYYDTTSYRTVRDGQCYAVEYTIHSTNIGNYDPSQGISEFNTQAVVTALEQAVQSFSFLPQ